VAEVEDATKDVEIESPDADSFINTDNLVDDLPIVGDAVGLAKDTISVASKLTESDGGDLAAGVSTIATDVTGFIASSGDTIMEIASDPLGWLVGQGLDFLLSVVQPIQDAIHLVSGDGPALSTAAENFSNIGEGMSSMATDFVRVADEALAQWGGEASKAAKQRLAEFANGINGVAAKAGDIAQLLQISSMLMEFIEELIKAILTELITWLIIIWIPALAAAAPTFGASTAAAGTATGVRVGTTAAKTTGKVNKLREILQKVLEWLRKLQEKLAGTKLGKFMEEVGQKASNTRQQGFVKTLRGSDGAFGNRTAEAEARGVVRADGTMNIGEAWSNEAFRDTLGAAGKKAAEEAIGVDSVKERDFKFYSDIAKKVAEYGKDANDFRNYGSTGEESNDDIRDDFTI